MADVGKPLPECVYTVNLQAQHSQPLIAGTHHHRFIAQRADARFPQRLHDLLATALRESFEEIGLEPGDVEEGLQAAAAIGDDRLQQMGQGRVVPETFTHGSSADRVMWLRRGLERGSLDACDTFGAAGTR